MTTDMIPIPVGVNDRDPSSFTVETSYSALTQETTVRVRPPIVPDAYSTLTEEYLVLDGDRAMDAAVRQAIRMIQDEALRRFKLDERVRQLQQEADAKVREARGKLIAELRQALGFALHDPADRETVLAALVDAEAAS